MEVLLWVLTGFTTLLAIASPWIVRPVTRALPHSGVGHVLEWNLFGFFVRLKYLSRRKNKLAREVRDLKKKLDKTKYELEQEEKHLKAKVETINRDYRNHLYDVNGKRKWVYLWLKSPLLDPEYLQELEADKAKSKQPPKREVMMTLAPENRGPGWSLDHLPPEFKGQTKVTFYELSNQDMAMSDNIDNFVNSMFRRGNKGNSNNSKQNNNG